MLCMQLCSRQQSEKSVKHCTQYIVDIIKVQNPARCIISKSMMYATDDGAIKTLNKQLAYVTTLQVVRQ